MELIQEFDIKQIRRNPNQPRRLFSEEEIEELSNSIKEIGLIHPPTARRISGSEVELISGERRLIASLRAGLKKIPLYIREATSKESSLAALSENIQRVDLNPLEVAHSLQQMMRELGLSQEEIAKKIGKKRPTITNFLRLLQLPPLIQKELLDKRITMGHAKAILSLENLQERLIFCELIIQKGLSVREAEERAKRRKSRQGKGRSKNPRFENNVKVKKLASLLQREVNLTPRYLCLRYFSEEDLSTLVDQLHEDLSCL